MKINFVFVPMGGGEADYSLEMEMQNPPAAGDYLSVQYPGETGTRDFIIKRIWWNAKQVEGSEGRITSASAECYFAEGGFSSEEHKSSYEMYKKRKNQSLEFDGSMY